VRSASGTNCLLNPQQSGAQVRIGGTFFNSGSGNPADDLWAFVIANHHDDIVDYGIWWGRENQSQWVHLTYIPMGTPGHHNYRVAPTESPVHHLFEHTKWTAGL